jgi:hypothetical protein
MSEIDVNGINYLIGRLNARQQWNVVRRLAPVIQGMMPLFANQPLVSDATGTLVPAGVSLPQMLAALTNTMGLLTDSDSDYVIDTCLNVVRFRSPGGSWAPLKAANGSGQVMLDQADDLATQMRLVWEVLYENLRNFSLETLLPSTMQATQTGSMAQA